MIGAKATEDGQNGHPLFFDNLRTARGGWKLFEFCDGLFTESLSEFLELESCLACTCGSGFVALSCLCEVSLKSGYYLINLCDCLFHGIVELVIVCLS